MTAPYGKTVAVIPQTVDKFGDRTAGTPTIVCNCVVYETPGVETVGRQDTLAYDATVLAPPGTVVTATDRLTIDGEVYEVVSQPIAWRSPLTGTNHGVQIQIRRVAG